MIKKYILFTGSNYYPLGGIGDFKGFFPSIEKAKAACNNLEDGPPDWAEIARHKDMVSITIGLSRYTDEITWEDQEHE